MRLHRLEVTAFGPFAGTVQVDLDAVSVVGPLSHPWCHGGREDQPARRRCVRALCRCPRSPVEEAAAQRPRRARHRAVGHVGVHGDRATAQDERSPEFHRPRTRGGGETKVQARAVLWEQRGRQWVALSTRHDEIADVVKGVLGMGLEQFSKVVLLPQGDFAAFLRATPEERRSLLERLFDVSTFAAVEEWFAAQRKDSAALVAEHRAALNADLAVLADVLADAPGLEAARGTGLTCPSTSSRRRWKRPGSPSTRGRPLGSWRSTPPGSPMRPPPRRTRQRPRRQPVGHVDWKPEPPWLRSRLPGRPRPPRRRASSWPSGPAPLPVT